MSEDLDEPGNVIRTSVSLPPYLHEWLKSLVKSKKFQSNSAAVVVALSELKGKLDSEDIKYNMKSNEKKRAGEDVFIMILLKLASKHPELRDEINEIMGDQIVNYYGSIKDMKKVIFE